jgi:hypothetical protein
MFKRYPYNVRKYKYVCLSYGLRKYFLFSLLLSCALECVIRKAKGDREKLTGLHQLVVCGGGGVGRGRGGVYWAKPEIP